ncbi:tetratricopeptide repeat protein [Bacteroidota bacterium]
MAQQGNTDYQYALIEAVKQKNLGNLPGAIELYRMVIEANDSVAVAHYELGTLLVLVGQSEEGVKELNIAYSYDPDNNWYRESYIDGLLMNKEYATAEKTLIPLIKEEDDNIALVFRLANVYFLSGKTNKAIRILNGVEKQYGISERISRLKANIYEKEEKYADALKEVEVLITLLPESVEYFVIAAEMAMQANREETAIRYYLEVMELDSSNIFAITNLADYYRKQKDFNKSFFYLNKSFESQEIDYDRKLAILSFYLNDTDFYTNFPDELMELIETMLKNHQGKREIHLYATDFFIQKGDYDKALEVLLPVLTNNESTYQIWKQALILAGTTGKADELIHIAAEGMKVFPDSVELIYFKGSAEFDQGKYDAVTHTFSSLSKEEWKQSEYYSDIRIILAESFYQLKEYNSSDSLFRVIVREEPYNYPVKNNFGYYLSLRNEALDEARDLSYSTIQDSPENATYLDTYAWILFKMNEFDEAEKYILLALKHGGNNDPDILEHAADIYMEMGKLEEARAYYEQAISSGGDETLIRNKVKNVFNEKK